MVILLLSRGYPTTKYKTNGIFEFDQAKSLAAAGHTVIFGVIDIRSFRKYRQFGFESKIKDGVYIEAVNIPLGPIPRKLRNDIKVFAFDRLYKYIVKKFGEPDILHAHFLSSGYVAAKVCAKRTFPLVLTEHLSTMNDSRLSKELLQIGNNTYPFVDKVITVSKSLSYSIFNNFGVESIVVPNIVDTTLYLYDRTVKELNENFYFISVGSLIERKGIDQLIHAFNEVFQHNKNVYLNIFGEGPEKKHLENLIKKYKLEKNVFLRGLADRSIIAEEMKKSDAFVLASKLETFGVVFIEAMAAGLPVIGTECGGPENIINENNGILINKNNSKELSEALVTMYNNINNYDNEYIASYAKRKFSPDVISKRLNKIYEQLVEEY